MGAGAFPPVTPIEGLNHIFTEVASELIGSGLPSLNYQPPTTVDTHYRGSIYCHMLCRPTEDLSHVVGSRLVIFTAQF